jgi:hypothetical protein
VSGARLDHHPAGRKNISLEEVGRLSILVVQIVTTTPALGAFVYDDR